MYAVTRPCADKRRQTLPVVMWLNAGVAAAAVGIALSAAPTASADDTGSTTRAASDARSNVGRASAQRPTRTRNTVPLAGAVADADPSRSPTVLGAATREPSGPRASSAVRTPPHRAPEAARRSTGPAEPAAATLFDLSSQSGPQVTMSGAAVPYTAAPPDIFGQIAAYFGLPGAPATTAPTIGAVPLFLRLQIGDLFGGSAPPAADRAVAITGLFREMLRQDPTAAELQNYLGVWNVFGINGVVAGLYSSTAFRQMEVNSYYLEMLGRAATQSELSWGATQLTWGVPEPMFVASLAGTPEFYTDSAAGGGTYGTQPSATTFVDLLYRSLVGKPADPSAAPIYVQQLRDGIPAGLVAAQFVTSDIFRQVKVNEVFTVAGLVGADSAPYVYNWFLSGGLAGIATEILTSPASVANLSKGVALPDMTTAAKLQSILLENYGNFVTDLKKVGTKANPCGSDGTGCGDNQALYNLIASGGLTRGIPNNAVNATSIFAQVSNIIPTQNEVDVDQSLLYPLRIPDTTALYLRGGPITAPGGIILTANNGTYVLDGHHRWSALYVMNPYTSIAAIDMGYVPTPQDGLKQTQLAIETREGYLPFKTVDGNNLFTIPRVDFDATVYNYIWNQNTVKTLEYTPSKDYPTLPGVFVEFMKFFDVMKDVKQKLDSQTKQLPLADKLYYTGLIQDYLWTNVLRMRDYNEPIPDATPRADMPQPEGNSYPPYLQLLESGAVSYTLPVISYLG